MICKNVLGQTLKGKEKYLQKCYDRWLKVKQVIMKMGGVDDEDASAHLMRRVTYRIQEYK